MALNMNRYRRKKAEVKRGSGKFWRPESKKKSPVRLFLFKHRVTKADFDLGRFTRADEVKVGEVTEELDCPIETHILSGQSPVICERMVGGDCEYCDQADRMRSQEDAKRRQAKAQHVVNIVPTGETPHKMTTWSMPSSVYEKLLGFVTDEEYEGLFGVKGRDFIIDYDKDRDPANMYQIRLRDKDKSAALDKSLQEQVQDLMSLKSTAPESYHDLMTDGADEDKGEGGVEDDEGEDQSPPFDTEDDLDDLQDEDGAESQSGDDDGAEAQSGDDDGAEAQSGDGPDDGALVLEWKNKIVEFTMDGEVVTGKVTDAEDGYLVVQGDDGSMYDVEPGNAKPKRKKAAKKATRKKAGKRKTSK